MYKEIHINLINVSEHVGNYRDNTQYKCDTKKDWQSIKVDTIFFAKRAKIGVHETIHINIIVLDFILLLCYFVILLLKIIKWKYEKTT